MSIWARKSPRRFKNKIVIPTEYDLADPKRVELIERHNARVMERKRRLHEARMARKAENLKAMEGVKVGDIFTLSWGYDQTNLDFFQVVALVGKSSVRVRPVAPEIISEEPGMMCAHRTYKFPQDGTLLPPLTRSVFIENCLKGDTKRVQAGVRDGDAPFIKLGSHYAQKEMNPTARHYESWYA